ncbi:MAG: DNA polymerase/3'-5' exonuclease PolX [Phycisphaerales bacterium]|nr:DNA polymerase/3'-5' exonuclease PolX [Phycisphaerales bacterium]
MSFQKNATSIFQTMSQMLELTGGDRFRVSAHAKASRVIKELTIDIEPLASAGDLKALVAIDGIGKGTASKLVELAQNGTITEYEELATKVPSGVMKVLSIQGLGPKSVKLMWDEKGVESIDDLKKIIEDGSILELPRMGAKTVENISASIEFLESSGKRLPIGIAQSIADRYLSLLKDTKGTIKVAYAGSLRRGKDTIGDVDILIASDDPEAAREAFVESPGVTAVLARGETKCSIRAAIGDSSNRWGADQNSAVQIDLRVVSESSWGAALLYFSGSKEHGVRLRERAIKMGMTLNEYGLFEDDGSDPTPPQTRGVDPVACETEESIYRALKMPFIPPTLREDRGEMSLEESVRVIELADIKAELHSHTIASDGKMTIEESAAIAKSRGFHTLAVTDHSQSSAVAGGLKPDRLREHILAVRKVDQKTDGISILAGSEVDILVDGTLDYDDELLHELDVVVASPHAGLRAKPKQATKRLLKAIEHPMVHVIGHPTGRLIERRPGLEPDMNELIAAAIEHNVALEINSHWMRLDLRDTHVRAAVEAGALISINCDDHHPSDYDNLKFGVMTGQRGWLTPELCINTWDANKLHGWLKSKR